LHLIKCAAYEIVERENAPYAECDCYAAPYPVDLTEKVIKERGHICSQLKLITDVIRTRAVPADLGEKYIEMTLIKVVSDSCVICLSPARAIDEWLIDVIQAEASRTNKNNE
jgi:hypothetical protein